MNGTILAVFAFVYAAMLLGRLPRLQLDRTGAALLGAIVLLATGAVTLDGAGDAVHVPTLALLFGLMVVSAQLRLGGFYSRVSRALAELPLSPPGLLGVTILAVGALSAVFSNDIVCLAVAPVLIEGCERRGTDPVPFLLALACAANVGSAATLIGNPQNMLVGQTLGLSFAGYLADAALPSLLGLAATWGIIAFEQHGRWRGAGQGAPAPPREGDPLEPIPAFDAWQTAKGLGVAAALLTSRKLHSRRMLGLVDWQLLVLFMGLFVVNDALAATGLPERAVAWLAERGLDPARPTWLFALCVLLSNAVSNVPAVMLLLPVAHHELAGPVLALASTLAGNLFLVGSIANLIVVDAAAQRGIALDWRRHARTGVPVTLATLAIAAACLAWSARG